LELLLDVLGTVVGGHGYGDFHGYLTITIVLPDPHPTCQYLFSHGTRPACLDGLMR
jgi:hypothetical protein